MLNTSSRHLEHLFELKNGPGSLLTEFLGSPLFVFQLLGQVNSSIRKLLSSQIRELNLSCCYFDTTDINGIIRPFSCFPNLSCLKISHFECSSQVRRIYFDGNCLYQVQISKRTTKAGNQQEKVNLYFGHTSFSKRPFTHLLLDIDNSLTITISPHIHKELKRLQITPCHLSPILETNHTDLVNLQSLICIHANDLVHEPKFNLQLYNFLSTLPNLTHLQIDANVTMIPPQQQQFQNLNFLTKLVVFEGSCSLIGSFDSSFQWLTTKNTQENLTSLNLTECPQQWMINFHDYSLCFPSLVSLSLKEINSTCEWYDYLDEINRQHVLINDERKSIIQKYRIGMQIHDDIHFSSELEALKIESSWINEILFQQSPKLKSIHCKQKRNYHQSSSSMQQQQQQQERKRQHLYSRISPYLFAEQSNTLSPEHREKEEYELKKLISSFRKYGDDDNTEYKIKQQQEEKIVVNLPNTLKIVKGSKLLFCSGSEIVLDGIVFKASDFILQNKMKLKSLVLKYCSQQVDDLPNSLTSAGFQLLDNFIIDFCNLQHLHIEKSRFLHFSLYSLKCLKEFSCISSDIYHLEIQRCSSLKWLPWNDIVICYLLIQHCDKLHFIDLSSLQQLPKWISIFKVPSLKNIFTSLKWKDLFQKFMQYPQEERNEWLQKLVGGSDYLPL